MIDSYVTPIQVEGHSNDVNTVAYADEGAQIFVSGSDDGLALVWDRRLLNQRRPQPVGTFVGHLNGLTHVCPRVWTYPLPSPATTLQAY